jgi:hypothetical protein
LFIVDIFFVNKDEINFDDDARGVKVTVEERKKNKTIKNKVKQVDN